MDLIDQKTKQIMEGCKERARDEGLTFDDESLEYIVTNRDLLMLSPKNMIPTMYDYWIHDIEVLKGIGQYELYPSNPYETVINTRPAISFYNDNNPDWLNVMIFYHVLAHIDFFQNNLYFRQTWDFDFNGQALADKRLISRLRREKGKWVDYVIEFSRGIDNLVGYFHELSELNRPQKAVSSSLLDFYFDVFLQSVKKVRTTDYIAEIDRFNKVMDEHGDGGEKFFLMDISKKYPELEATFEKSKKGDNNSGLDIFQYLMQNSEFLQKEENKWMHSVMEVIRKTSLFFQPQIRSKIMNEGWASYWHEMLFLKDDRILGHEVDFARVNAWVTSLPRVGMNPYALGLRLFWHIEEMADKGRISYDFQRIKNAEDRKNFDRKTGTGRDFIFKIRENYCDFTFLSEFINQDFVNEHKLFVAGKRLNKERMVWEYYVKSKDANEYKNMLLSSLYHPPVIQIDSEKGDNGGLYLVHRFEQKPLVKDFIANTMIGLEYFWDGPVHLETSEPHAAEPKRDQYMGVAPFSLAQDEEQPVDIVWKRVLYTMKDRKLTRTELSDG